jgi:competence protein ComEA
MDADGRAAPSTGCHGGREPSKLGSNKHRVGYLNTATAAQLDALPGIGPAYAQRILDYRERNGPFRSVQQLRDARLIPNATFERLKDRLAVE